MLEDVADDARENTTLESFLEVDEKGTLESLLTIDVPFPIKQLIASFLLLEHQRVFQYGYSLFPCFHSAYSVEYQWHRFEYCVQAGSGYQWPRFSKNFIPNTLIDDGRIIAVENSKTIIRTQDWRLL